MEKYKDKFNKELVEYLDNWCNKNDDQLSRYSWELKDNGQIYVYRYYGSGKPTLVNRFSSNEQLEKLKREHEEYIKDMIEFEEIMKKDLSL